MRLGPGRCDCFLSRLRRGGQRGIAEDVRLERVEPEPQVELEQVAAVRDAPPVMRRSPCQSGAGSKLRATTSKSPRLSAQTCSGVDQYKA